MKKLKVKNMSNFQLSSHIDANKVFLYKRSELEGRWDPLFYSSNYRFIIQNTKFELSKLGNVILYSKSGFGAGKNDQADSLKNGVIHIRPTNLNKDGLLTVEKSIYVPERKNETTLSIGDVLFNNTNSQELVGKTGLYSSEQKSFLEKKLGVDKLEKLYFSNHITCIRVDNAKITPEYLWLILNLYQSKNIFYSLCTNWNNQSGIGLDLLRSLKIPIPGLEQQKSLTNLLLNAQAYRQQKEQEAQNLLDSIDDYLMKELDIELPEIDNSLESRVFQTTFSEITGKKFDAFGTKNYLNKMKSRKYEEINLSSVAYLEKGISITSNSITSGKYPVIAGGQSSPYNHNEYNHIGNVITISASGAYAGFVWYHSTPIFASDCTKVFSKDEKQITTPYIYEILKLKQQDIYNLQVGAGQPHVYSSDLSKILIPLVDFKIQNKIVSHIQSIREQAKQLQNDAQQQFEEAKKEIERMILGER